MDKTKLKNQMTKSNVTLWKSKYNQTLEEENKKVEPDYIENLKKQVYFMEMELKLMKEREKEIDKNGGFTQLFNDDRDPSQHILQLKQKYSSMRKNLENKIEDLSQKKRSVCGSNVSLKSKLDSLKNIEKEMFNKLIYLEENSNQNLMLIENDFVNRNRERVELEADNRLNDNSIKIELENNKNFEYTIKSSQKEEELKQSEFEKQMEIIEKMTKEKMKVYETINNQIKELDHKTIEEPFFKIESEKNIQYKKKIEIIERDIIEVNTTIEGLQIVNEYLVKKKEDITAERKRITNLNDDLKKEIESRNQLNEIRVQKKVKENNSEEIQKLNSNLESVIKNITELENKILHEFEKIKMLTNEIFKLNIDLKNKENKKVFIVESVDNKIKLSSELKTKLEEAKTQHNIIKEKVFENINLVHERKNRKYVIKKSQ